MQLCLVWYQIPDEVIDQFMPACISRFLYRTRLWNLSAREEINCRLVSWRNQSNTQWLYCSESTIKLDSYDKSNIDGWGECPKSVGAIRKWYFTFNGSNSHCLFPASHSSTIVAVPALLMIMLYIIYYRSLALGSS